MTHISLRVTDQEKAWMESYAKLIGLSLSEMLKATFFEKLEDEYDLKAIQEYETEKEAGKVEYYSLDEVKRELGFSE
jgi:hypothetical protein